MAINRNGKSVQNVLLLMVICLITFGGCSDEELLKSQNDHYTEIPVKHVIDAETEQLLKQDYWQYVFVEEQRSFITAEEVPLDYYLGTYNGYVIFVNLLKNHSQMPVSVDSYSTVSIHGYKFIFPRDFNIYAWKQGAFCVMEGSAFYDLDYRVKPLDEALNKDLSLTADDAKRMYEQYLTYNVIIKEDFYSGAFEGLSEEKKKQIKLDWYNDIFDDWWRDYVDGMHDFVNFSTFKEVWIDYYLGTYNGYTVIAVLRSSRWTSRIIINGYEFVFPTDFLLYAWKQDGGKENGNFYRILNERDFNALYLSDDDAKRMYERYLTLNIQDDKRINSKNFDGLDAETAWQIRQFFWNMDRPYFQSFYPVDDIPIYHYFGTYNDYVIFVNDSSLPAISSFTAYGFSFTFPKDFTSYAWKQNEKTENGQIFSISKDYGNYEVLTFEDILTQEDALQMYKRYLRMNYLIRLGL
ncbi:MAG: hypothetical protein FWB73_03610 [Treponema sp.]|nr:hypothetical protein [Treponema sp.]